MPLTDKKKKSNKKSQDKNSMRFSVITSKEQGNKIIEHINKFGYSKNGFIVKAIEEKIKRDEGQQNNEIGYKDEND